MKLTTLAYLRQDGKTLMLQKAKGYQKGKWNGLGGKFEPGESPEDCLKREVYEESGLTVTAATLKGFISFPDFDGQDDWYTFVYVVTGFTGELQDSAEGRLAWIADDDLLTLNIWEGDRIFLPWLAKPGLFSAKFVYKNGQFQRHEVVFYR